MPASCRLRKEICEPILHHCPQPPQGQFTFSSARVKPRPARTRRLYLMVGHRTTGRSLSTGRGATAAALAIRASRRRCFRPGYRVAREYVSRPNFSNKIFAQFRSVVERLGEEMVFQRDIRSRTWSKCTRTRRCQSLRKSIQKLSALRTFFEGPNRRFSPISENEAQVYGVGITHGSSGFGCCA